MATSTEERGGGIDNAKLVLAVAVLCASIFLFYWYGEAPLLYRVLGLLAGVGMSLAIFLYTSSGQRLNTFLKSVRVEIRKVVWPTRQETLQTTLVVLVLVFIVGLLLWLLDSLLGWAFAAITGIGG